MSSNMRIYLIRVQIRKYTDKELVRLMRRIWDHIEEWYGRGVWDWPTLYHCYPQLACTIRAIQDEMRHRNEVRSKEVMCG